MSKSHAILITEDTMPLIRASLAGFNQSPNRVDFTLSQPADWYYAIYYRAVNNKVHEWTAIPASLFERLHDIDKEQAKTKFTLYISKD